MPLLLLRLIARLPLGLVHALGGVLGLVTYALSPTYRRRLRANLAQAGFNVERLALACAREAGKQAVETPWIWMRPPEDLRRVMQVVDGEVERAAVESGRPVIYLTPHLGCFEITAQYCVLNRWQPPHSLTALYRVPRKEILRPLVESNKLYATKDFSVVRDLDTINIAVPTPLRKTKDPDMSYIVSACQETAKHFGPGKLVILESTTYPGTTDELVLPMLQRPDLKVGEQFFLCFSPERVDPGNPKYHTTNIPKVVGGITPEQYADRFGLSPNDMIAPAKSAASTTSFATISGTVTQVYLWLIANTLAFISCCASAASLFAAG